MKPFIYGVTMLTLAFALPSLATVPTWTIVPAKSSLSFTATQNNAPVTGQFKQFTGTIQFDPKQLSDDKVTIVVDTRSVNASYGEIADTLKSKDWFNIASFPKAMFNATQFTSVGDNQYQANGNLTIRDKTLPVTLTFTLKTYTDTQAVAVGTAQISRTQFGVGQGQWADTSAIKDNVQIAFVLTAVKAA